ncbi:integral membrane protein [Streptacidiphilus sp. EB129]
MRDPLLGGYARSVKNSTALLKAYRVLAYVTGVGLLLLCASCVAWYGFGTAQVAVAVVGTIHGWAFMLYAVVAFTLGNKLGWPMSRMAWVILAGTIPTCSFIAERRVMQDVRAQLAEQDEALVSV